MKAFGLVVVDVLFVAFPVNTIRRVSHHNIKFVMNEFNIGKTVAVFNLGVFAETAFDQLARGMARPGNEAVPGMKR